MESDKLLSSFKKYRWYILAGVIVLILIVVVVLLLDQDDSGSVRRGSIEQPISQNVGKRISVSRAVAEESEVGDRGDVYELIKDNHADSVASFVVKSGVISWRRGQVEEILYSWQPSQPDGIHLVQYNSIFDRVYFKFEQGVNPLSQRRGFLTEGEIEQYFTDTINQIFDTNFTFTNFKITQESDVYRVEANRVINGLPLYTSTLESFSDYILFETDGDLLEGQLYLFEVDPSTKAELPLLSPLKLGGYLSQDDYPKEFSQAFPEDFDYSLVTGEPYTAKPGDPFTGDAPVEDIEIPDATSCEVTNIDLVYYYSSTEYKKLSPTYRIDCVGVTTYEGRSFTVDILIHASALDPEYVYIEPEQ